MAYADQQMSGSRITVLIIVVLIHLAVGYALVSGLAYSSVQQIMKHVTTVNVEKDKPKPPPPPPPKTKAPPPPIVAPPPPINVSVAPPPVQTVAVAPPPAPIVLAPPAPAPAPPPAPSKARGASPKNASDWSSRIQENYPGDALRANKEGRVGMSVTVGPDGKVSACSVTSSSGTPSLDAAACHGMQQYARYNPALDAAGNPTTATMSQSIVYKIPQDE